MDRPWIGKLNTVKTSTLSNLIYRLNSIIIKIPASYFVDIDKLNLNLHAEAEGPDSQRNIDRKGQSQRTNTDLKNLLLCYSNQCKLVW